MAHREYYREQNNNMCTLTKLDSNPMFKLSLGSKELFHSNFLEYIWNINHNLFIDIVNNLLSVKLPKPGKYILSREKKNFDLCRYHYDAQNKEVYDLIIENKVKGIPYKEQLRAYYNNAKNVNGSTNTPRLLLLSLVSNFTDRSCINNNSKTYGSWVIADYDMLKNAIINKKSTWGLLPHSNYINDYCDFIGLMHVLQNDILSNISNEPLFKDVAIYKNFRLHDLYIKLRCADFLMKVKSNLVKAGLSIPVQFLNKYNEMRNNKNTGIFLNVNINQGEGQAAIFLYDQKSDDIYDFVIQGYQYRHGINSLRHHPPCKDKDKSRNKLWKAIQKNPNDKTFLNKILCYTTLPTIVKGAKTGAYCGYDHNYIYKYIKYNDTKYCMDTVCKLAKAITKDIINFCSAHITYP